MRWISPLLLFPIVGIALGCGGSAVDITASQSTLSLHFGAGCALVYSGKSVVSGGPVAVDIACPDSLTDYSKNPTFHLSVPIGLQTSVNNPISQALQDPHYGMAGYVPGQFVVLTWFTGNLRNTCDSQAAAGSVIYTAVPSGQSEVSGQHLTGHFSPDATLSDCAALDPTNPSASRTPLSGTIVTLSGSFDLQTP